MDNLTHSLAGALLGQMGLKRLTARAMPTLIIAANIPDLDAITTVLGTESLAMRRGLTHGPVALLVLPLLLTGLMLLWNRWRPAEQQVRPGALLLVAYIGTLSHPALDWLNSYGIRLLEPFSSRWYAGDTLFIIDVWVWAALIIAFGWSRFHEKRSRKWQRPAWLGFTAICAYILANGLITGQAEALGRQAVPALVRQDIGSPADGLSYRSEMAGRSAGTPVVPELVVANPQPLRFWRRRVLWRGSGLAGALDYDWLRESDGIIFRGPTYRTQLDHPALAATRGRPEVVAFLFWSRMPYVTAEEGRFVLKDQRFASSLRRSAGRTVGEYDPFTVPLSPEPKRR
ncbi:metal-dependent hydrolase [Sphingomonas sp. GCM10030256]|uniref:metal-dependent hydrolase n=1 Tax=Sphingomonas sp. GCM10030256 TaxID=3273427 RepID=UPI003615A520